ncbi:hypothetical protein SYNPS1DRAFT_31704 [Syncephalis pseudoplumigaleata]|uniref:Symplekin C-terminal domain-containing protein n=1 Tax=Syncephalis pseudoplumigaleata TaxID=1712513 RepID=A0A4P9YSM4_9FUNG|nr:hypothetical protein SYNPS1DRAFT_31704 [Syncephalis pseudoplumigaleata]|eukprot:RKP22678.1 hypothetical protein SYNPS1DRAFT_31704 [Syncephalis pseudoplumigaleata]
MANPHVISEAEELTRFGLSMIVNEPARLGDWLSELGGQLGDVAMLDEPKKEEGEEGEDGMVERLLDIIVRVMPRHIPVTSILLEHYDGYSMRTKMAIKAKIIEPILAIGQVSTELLAVLGSAPTRADELVAWIVRLLVSDAHPSRALRQTILDREARNGAGSAAISWMVVTAVDRHQIEAAMIDALGALNRLDQLPDMIRSMLCWLKRDLDISADDVLFMAINGTTRPNAKRMGKVIDQFILLPDIFDRSIIQDALTRAYRTNNPSILLMRVTMQVMRAYPEMLDVCLDLVGALILQPVWDTPQFEAGFVRFVKMCQPRSLKLLHRLGKAHKHALLEANPDLKAALRSGTRFS